MGLTSHNLKYLLRITQKHGIKGPVLTFGNQDCYATQEDLVRWFRETDLTLNIPTETHFSTSKSLSKINKKADRFIHAKTFFAFLGIDEKDYYDIDKFDFDHPAIMHDLEQPIDQKYHNFFNFVLDSGTLEHIFDIKAVMSNIVHITKPGGYVFQLIPAQNFLNHGFYQISPTFFYDFYTANGFEIIESYIIEIRGRKQRFYKYDQHKDYLSLFFKPSSRLVNCFLTRKIETVNEVTSPIQYMYKLLDQNPDIVENDWNKTTLDKVVSIIRGIVPMRFQGSFFSLWSLLKRLTTKREYFDIKS
jgi:SAM-dependent methyltransferase